ncbi:MAG: OmpP1/FadL family transporter [Shimia sp.]|uniref:OmpP1/FadL family transporter n=1 Tax=Shimia sp. TaxID=1954381 RepID=UPI00405875BA
MKKTILGATALAFVSGAAHAGGIDRSGQGVNILFEEGDFAQFSFSSIDPSVSGTGAADVNDVAKFYTVPSFGYKHAVNDKIHIAVIYDQPFGAHIHYPTLGGAGAEIDSEAMTGLIRYSFDNGMSVYGGARAMRVGGTIVSTPGILDAQGDYDFGGVFGFAYEKPEIALRVALTYSSSITASLDGTHNIADARSFDVEFPESVNLDFQTGIAENTLLFGSVRWVGWEGFNLTTAEDGEWVAFTEDTITYSLGVGRQITDKLSLAISAGYEKPGASETDTLLAPTTGSTSIGVAATYQLTDNLTLSGGLNYIWLGDAYYDLGGGNLVNFQDNTAIGAGFRIGMSF